ncbi:MAG: anaerobic carbon-monoxide dehydrogenase catalytic subunit [Planctomycetota bacterium]|nr:anaerobic carbon-monoxide dehydrogenase catalytic subunit [Planctomycetota bacterium]
MKPEKRSSDPATVEMLSHVAGEDISVAWNRADQMEPQCGFGQLGICCRNCTMGPCRIDPFGEGSDAGICGADADIIAARNLIRMIAGGASAHSDHGRDVAHTLLMAAEDENCDYKIKDETKLRALAAELGVATDGKSLREIAKAVAEIAFSQFGQQHGEVVFAARAPEDQKTRWRDAGVMPRGVDREIVEIMHRTHIGVDNDAVNLILQGVRACLSDGWGGSMIATDLSDVLFRTPDWVVSRANLGVLEADTVNIIVHGHEPTLSEMIVAAAQDKELIDLAKSKGATGITLGGICCTANEILMRHGIPLAGNFLQQELAIATGVVEAMIVDVQCIMPALGPLVRKHKYHTRLISTSPKAKFPYATHVEFSETRAMEIARQIVRMAVENFPNRDKSRIHIPEQSNPLVAGFTAENIYTALGGRYRPSYRPLNDAIISGRLRGVAGVVGCNNPKIRHDFGHVEMTKELLANDVLVAVTGCTAVADAKAGLLCPEAAEKFAGKGLREICRAVGIPPVLHLGSCVDNSRILVVLSNMVKEGGLGDSIADLPVAGAAPEWMSEKAVSIGFYVVASGVYTVLGEPLPVQGAKGVTKFVTEDIEELFGGKFAFEADPVKAARMMIDHIDLKRAALKLSGPMYDVPYAPKTVAETKAAG